MNRSLLIITLLCSQLLCITVGATEPKTIKFAVNSPGSFPYLYFNETTQTYSGLVVDFFKHLENKGLLVAQFVDSNQTRSEQFVIDGKVDLILANPKWLEQPAKTISSKPIISHQTYLYSLKPFAADFAIARLTNKRICTHQSFIYTGLTTYFSSGMIKRVDASSHHAMLTMLEKQRCDYAVMNNYNAIQAFSTATFCHLILYQSPQPSSEVDLHFVMNANLHALKTLIDQQLDNFRDTGEMLKSLQSHASEPVFPLSYACP